MLQAKTTTPDQPKIAHRGAREANSRGKQMSLLSWFPELHHVVQHTEQRNSARARHFSERFGPAAVTGHPSPLLLATGAPEAAARAA